MWISSHPRREFACRRFQSHIHASIGFCSFIGVVGRPDSPPTRVCFHPSRVDMWMGMNPSDRQFIRRFPPLYPTARIRMHATAELGESWVWNEREIHAPKRSMEKPLTVCVCVCGWDILLSKCRWTDRLLLLEIANWSMGKMGKWWWCCRRRWWSGSVTPPTVPCFLFTLLVKGTQWLLTIYVLFTFSLESEKGRKKADDDGHSGGQLLHYQRRAGEDLFIFPCGESNNLSVWPGHGLSYRVDSTVPSCSYTFMHTQNLLEK